LDIPSRPVVEPRYVPLRLADRDWLAERVALCTGARAQKVSGVWAAKALAFMPALKADAKCVPTCGRDLAAH